jgi:branched-chain amino acid transport system substrate-binding protein
VTQQSKEVAGLENIVLASADGCFSDAAAEAIGDAGEGMYFSGPDLSFSGSLYEDFKVRYMDNYGSDPLSVFHAHAFDATNMIFQCIEQVGVQEEDGTLHVGRQALRDCLYATSGFSGITGTSPVTIMAIVLTHKSQYPNCRAVSTSASGPKTKYTKPQL